jgi:hypothetical protein
MNKVYQKIFNDKIYKVSLNNNIEPSHVFDLFIEKANTINSVSNISEDEKQLIIQEAEIIKKIKNKYQCQKQNIKFETINRTNKQNEGDGSFISLEIIKKYKNKELCLGLYKFYI